MNGAVKAGEMRTGESALYAIVYVSKAARPLTLEELRSIHVRAQTRNAKDAVTGVLLYSDGAFMQYLEGPAHGLTRAYERIKPNPWHYGLIDLYREPIVEREFSEWSMAFRMVGAFGRSSESEQDEVLAEKLAAATNRHSLPYEYLASFWGRGRSALASTLLDFSKGRAQRIALGQGGQRSWPRRSSQAGATRFEVSPAGGGGERCSR